MANGDIVTVQGEIRSQSLPATNAEGALQPVRLGKYREQYSLPLMGAKMHALTDEGSYFVANNPTAGTGVAGITAPTAFSATTPLMVIYNGNATGGKSIYLDTFRLSVTAAGTSGTNWNWQMNLDASNRYTSGGSAITPNNLNIASSVTSGATINFGAITATAATTSVRKVAAAPGRTVIKVIGDEYTFRFGDSAPVTTGMPLEGTLQLHRSFQVPAVVIPPGYSFLFYEWAASQAAAASYEFQLTYVER